MHAFLYVEELCAIHLLVLGFEGSLRRRVAVLKVVINERARCV